MPLQDLKSSIQLNYWTLAKRVDIMQQKSACCYTVKMENKKFKYRWKVQNFGGNTPAPIFSFRTSSLHGITKSFISRDISLKGSLSPDWVSSGKLEMFSIRVNQLWTLKDQPYVLDSNLICIPALHYKIPILTTALSTSLKMSNGSLTITVCCMWWVWT